ncbi:MAG: MlaD family protein, partial [Myxococcota bacterium]
MSDRRTSPAPWRVGLLALAALVVLIGVLVMVGPLRLYDGVPLEVDFAYAGPIKPGAAVRLSGVVVGAVERVELLAGTDEAAGPDVMVRVHARVEDRAMPAITPETRFYVTTLGVLGEHYLELVPGSPRSAPLSRGSRVRGIDLARSDLLLPRAAALLEVMTAILDEGREDAVGLLRQAGSLLAR